MDLQLTNRIALVTGASRGIGAATATMLAQEGADVFVAYHKDQAGAEKTAAAVRSAGRKAGLCPMDVGNTDSVATAVERLANSASHLDVAVLCAGVNSVVPFDELEPAEWDKVVDVNLNGAFRLLRAIQPLLADGSSVVLVSSVAAHTGAPHHPHYAAAKAGLVNLTKSAARAWAPRVRVNCVAPGLTETDMGAETIRSLPKGYVERNLLTRRCAKPEEIAALIVFLTSPKCGFITGATVDVNGGRLLR